MLSLLKPLSMLMMYLGSSFLLIEQFTKYEWPKLSA
jgi:hypothetical protein